jgi:uncharacterized delta-60 repeat protein
MKHRTLKLSHSSMIMALLLVMISLLTAISAYAAPGDLDTEFNSPDGYAVLNLEYTSFANEIAIQDDGKIVVAGTNAETSSMNTILLARYNTDGSLDTTFGGGNGYVTTVIGSNLIINDVAIQSDGYIVVVGTDSVSSYNDAIIARYTSNGVLDTTGFGAPNGYVTLNINTYDVAYGVAIQSNGKIVVGGHTKIIDSYEIFLARINSDGSLDTTFGSGNGYIVEDLSYENEIFDIAIQEDGNIVIAGLKNTSEQYDFLVARFSSTGSLDTTFGSGVGYVITDIGGSSYDDSARSTLIQKDGKILVGGMSIHSSSSVTALARYNTDGSLDTTGFGSPNGYVTLSTGSSTYPGISDMALQADGKIVFAGSTYNSSYSYDMLVGRYNSDGSLDSGDFGFSTDGKLTEDLGSDITAAFGVAIQPKDGKIVVAGGRSDGTYTKLMVARFLVAASETQTIADGDSDTMVDVDIYNDSGSSCDFTVVKNPVPPGDAPANKGEMPVQWKVSSTCSPVNVDLVFHYTDDELANANSVTEVNLISYKYIGGWVNQCSTHTCVVDAGANTVTIQGVTSLSDWTLGDPTTSGNSDPTSVTLKSVSGNAMAKAGMFIAVVGICAGGLALVWRRRRN